MTLVILIHNLKYPKNNHENYRLARKFEHLILIEDSLCDSDLYFSIFNKV